MLELLPLSTREQLEDILEKVGGKPTLLYAFSITYLSFLLLPVTSTFTSFHANEYIQSFRYWTRSPGLNSGLLQREIYNPIMPAGQHHGSPIMVIFRPEKIFRVSLPKCSKCSLHFEVCLCLDLHTLYLLNKGASSLEQLIFPS